MLSTAITHQETDVILIAHAPFPLRYRATVWSRDHPAVKEILENKRQADFPATHNEHAANEPHHQSLRCDETNLTQTSRRTSFLTMKLKEPIATLLED